MSAVSQSEARELVAAVERHLEELDGLQDGAARSQALETVQALLELYGLGLERIVEEVAARDDGAVAQALADDELVAHLLLLHGLHPVPLQERVLDALGEVRPYLESHGGNVELLDIGEGRVRLRLQGSCSGCPSSAMTLKLAIENAIRKSAPEIEEVVAEAAPVPAPDPALLQIEVLPGPAGGAGAVAPDGHWAGVGGLPDLAEAGTLLRQVEGQPILFVKLGGTILAYRPECPACGDSLARAAPPSGGALACPGCGGRYDVLRAGRGLDAPQLHLEPVPLLVGDAGLVRVALPVVV